jgi:hypothetical protein
MNMMGRDMWNTLNKYRDNDWETTTNMINRKINNLLPSPQQYKLQSGGNNK